MKGKVNLCPRTKRTFKLFCKPLLLLTQGYQHFFQFVITVNQMCDLLLCPEEFPTKKRHALGACVSILLKRVIYRSPDGIQLH